MNLVVRDSEQSIAMPWTARLSRQYLLPMVAFNLLKINDGIGIVPLQSLMETC